MGPYKLKQFGALLLISALAACGGGGGGEGGPGSGPPSISNLSYNPTSVYVNFGGGQVTVSGSVTFTNASGGIASATIEVLNSAGATVSTSTSPVAGGSGVISGTASGTVLAGTTVVDNYTVRVWITDLAGRISNTLTGSFRVAQNPWTARAPMPNSRQDFAVAMSGGLVYVIGGELLGTGTFPGPASGVVDIYDPASNTWSSGIPLPTPRKKLTAATVNGVIYVIGGEPAAGSGFNSTIVEAFDPAAPVPAWTTKAPMPTARHAAAATAINEQICVFGGLTGPNTISSVECFNPVANAWSTEAPMPTARSSLGSALLGGFAYAVGGHGALTSPAERDTVERFDIANRTWSSVASMSTWRESAAVVAASGLLFAIGGQNAAALDSTEAYDPSAGRWRNKTSMPMPLTRLGAVAIDGSIYVFHSGNTLQYRLDDDLL
jgi:hypothetical protein